MGGAAAGYYAKFPATAALHALLGILYASLQPATATLSYDESDFAIRQTRSRKNLDELSWQVWGVATVLLGGADANNLFYLFDCYHSTFTDGLAWVRVDADVEVNNDAFDGGGATRLRVSVDEISNYLGLYACTAPDGSMEHLNITDEVPGLVAVERNVEAIAGNNATLSSYISTTNGQLRLVQWKNPAGQTVSEYPPPGTEEDATPTHLLVEQVSLADSGIYNLTVQSSEFIVNHIGHILFELSVLVPSNITGPPMAEVTTDEWVESLQLTCSATGSAPLSVSWSRPGLSLPVNSLTHSTSADNTQDGTVTVTGTLTLYDVRYNDRGSYRCTAYNSLSRVNHTDTTDTVLSVNPGILIESESLASGTIIEVSLGTSLTVDCFGSGNLRWTTPTGDDVTNNPADPNYPLFTTSDPSRNVLTLSIPNFLDDAMYTCVSDLAEGLQRTVFITTKAILSVFIPSECILALRGSAVSISAHIHSIDEVISILWYRNGILLDPESDDSLAIGFSDTMATLKINSFDDEHVGVYVVVVTSSDNSMANASVEVSYAVPASAEVSPEQLTVEVGDSVEINCTAEGSGPLRVEWTNQNGQMVAVGDRLFIESASLLHSGVYQCNVSSPFSNERATFELSVLERLVALIEYDDIISNYHEVTFHHGNGSPPSFRCLVNGSASDTLFTWQLSGGGALPSVTSVDASHTLTWTHRLEYTDTGTYQCVVREPSTDRERVASLQMTVVYDPVLDTIFPAPGITNGPVSVNFNVPLGFTGPALTCTGFASPDPPSIRWSKDSGSLPRGVDFQTTSQGGVAVSVLVFSEQFSVADVGEYKCEVSGEEGVVDSELVELSQAEPTLSSSPLDCEGVSEDSVLFQIRVGTSGCPSWNQETRSAITEETQNLLLRLLLSQCSDCEVTKTTLTVVSLECSDIIEGGAVFRGSIATGSAPQTEMVTCALSRWQRSRPLLSVNGNRFLVDSNCRLRIDSYSEDECLETEREGQMDLNMILIIALPVGCVVLLVVVVVAIVVCYFRCRQCRGDLKISDGTGPYEISTLSYFRTTTDHAHPHTATAHCSSRPSISSMNRQEDNPFYDDRYQCSHQPPSPVYDEAISPDCRPLFGGPPEPLPREPETNFSDSGVSLSMVAPVSGGSPPHEPRQAHVGTAAQPYQIPTASTGSLNKVGVANPLWDKDPAPQRGERRFSDSPNRFGMSCFAIQHTSSGRPTGHLSMRDQTTGLSASSEDYARLDFSPSSKSVSCLAAPERKWYNVSDAAYASLGETNTTIRLYDSVRNSHIRASPATSPQGKAPPTSHTHRGPLPMVLPQGVKNGPPRAPSTDAIPSSYLPNRQQQLQTSLV